MFETRPSPFSYLDYIGIAIATLVAERIINKVLDRYNILTWNQMVSLGHVLITTFYAYSLRLDRNLMFLCLCLRLYRFAGTFANSMQNDFDIIVYFAIKRNPNFKTMKELMEDKSSRYWTKIIQIDKLAKNPIDSFILFYPLTKQ